MRNGRVNRANQPVFACKRYASTAHSPGGQFLAAHADARPSDHIFAWSFLNDAG
jgi:hypothetical protein